MWTLLSEYVGVKNYSSDPKPLSVRVQLLDALTIYYFRSKFGSRQTEVLDVKKVI